MSNDDKLTVPEGAGVAVRHLLVRHSFVIPHSSFVIFP